MGRPFLHTARGLAGWRTFTFTLELRAEGVARWVLVRLMA